MKVPARTFMLTLPDGRRVRCWQRDEPAIRADVRATGSVMLVKSPDADVYERVPPRTLEEAALTPFAERVDGRRRPA